MGCGRGEEIRNLFSISHMINVIRPRGYKRVYLPLHEVVDTPFYIQGDSMYHNIGGGPTQDV